MSEKPISPLRRRMIEDMTVRNFVKTHNDYIRHVRTFTTFLGRAPDTAAPEDLRLFQLHQTRSRGTTPLSHRRQCRSRSDMLAGLNSEGSSRPNPYWRGAGNLASRLLKSQYWALFGPAWSNRRCLVIGARPTSPVSAQGTVGRSTTWSENGLRESEALFRLISQMARCCTRGTTGAWSTKTRASFSSSFLLRSSACLTPGSGRPR